MKVLTLSTLAIALVVSSPKTTSLKKQDINASTVTCIQDKPAFLSGERLTFKIYYNWTAVWVSAGELSMHVKQTKRDGVDVYHATTLGETYKSYEWFYKVKDKYESFMEVGTMRPVRFQRDVFEGGFLIKEHYDFDHNNKKVVRDIQEPKPARVNEHQIPSCVHDVVSAIYYARSIDYSAYKVGDIISLPVFIDGETYDTYLRFKGKETIKTKMGKYETFKLAASMLDNGYFDGGEDLIIWVTDDENKVPVRIESPLSVGSIKADLKSYSGLHTTLEESK